MGPPGNTRRDVLSGLLALGSALAGTPAIAADEFKFGLTPVFLTNDLELLARLRHYLERRTGDSVRLVTKRTYQEITSLLISGQLDAAWICGFPFVAYPTAARTRRRAGLARQAALSVLPHRRPRPRCADLDDLKGDVHAFSDPDSNSGWLVTRRRLRETRPRPDGSSRRRFFTWGHRNVVRAVASASPAAAASTATSTRSCARPSRT